MIFEKYFCGQHPNAAQKALWDMVKAECTERPYTETIRRRVAGVYADICTDNFYVAHEGGRCYSRLYTSWGKHKDSIGNFGHFVTLEECRGQGIGREVLKIWADDIYSRSDVPLGLFCTATAQIAELYRPYGFREIDPNAKGGYLYCPLGNSPESFRELCDQYYQPSDILIHRPASMEYRHELDCLLRFALSLNGDKDFPAGGYYYLEELIITEPRRVGMLFSKDNHCVGYTIDGNIAKVHPQYRNATIIDYTKRRPK